MALKLIFTPLAFYFDSMQREGYMLSVIKLLGGLFMKLFTLIAALFISTSSFASSSRCEVFLRSDNQKEYIEVAKDGTSYDFAIVVKSSGEKIPSFSVSEYETEFETYQNVSLSDGRAIVCKVGSPNVVDNFCVEVAPGSSRVERFFLVPVKNRKCQVARI